MITSKALALLIRFKYPLIIPLALVEGPVIMMMCGFLVKLGYLALIPTYFLLMLGDTLGDIFWYCLGYYLGGAVVRKLGRFVSIEEKDVETVKKIFYRHQSAILFISKITMGFGFALVTLVTAGMVRIPFRKYFLFNALGQFLWTGILMAVGFYLGKFYLTLSDVLGKVSVIALFILIGLFLAGFGKYLKRRITSKFAS